MILLLLIVSISGLIIIVAGWQTGLLLILGTLIAFLSFFVGYVSLIAIFKPEELLE